MSVSIRPYEPGDLNACRDLWCQLTERHRDIYDDQTIGGDEPGLAFDAHLESPRVSATWVAEKDGAVVGFCSLLVDGEEGEIDPVVVRSDERSRGIGRQLIEVAIEEARRRGVRFLGLRPVARNMEAIRLYHDMGFTVLGQIEQFMDLTESPPREWKPGITIHDMDFRY